MKKVFLGIFSLVLLFGCRSGSASGDPNVWKGAILVSGH
jgi:hypothetical protein